MVTSKASQLMMKKMLSTPHNQYYQPSHNLKMQCTQDPFAYMSVHVHAACFAAYTRKPKLLFLCGPDHLTHTAFIFLLSRVPGSRDQRPELILVEGRLFQQRAGQFQRAVQRASDQHALPFSARRTGRRNFVAGSQQTLVRHGSLSWISSRHLGKCLDIRPRPAPTRRLKFFNSDGDLDNRASSTILVSFFMKHIRLAFPDQKLRNLTKAIGHSLVQGSAPASYSHRIRQFGPRVPPPNCPVAHSHHEHRGGLIAKSKLTLAPPSRTSAQLRCTTAKNNVVAPLSCTNFAPAPLSSSLRTSSAVAPASTTLPSCAVALIYECVCVGRRTRLQAAEQRGGNCRENAMSSMLHNTVVPFHNIVPQS